MTKYIKKYKKVKICENNDLHSDENIHKSYKTLKNNIHATKIVY